MNTLNKLLLAFYKEEIKKNKRKLYLKKNIKKNYLNPFKYNEQENVKWQYMILSYVNDGKKFITILKEFFEENNIDFNKIIKYNKEHIRYYGYHDWCVTLCNMYERSYPINVISSLFTFNKTEEKYDYWADINVKWIEKVKKCYKQILKT